MTLASGTWIGSRRPQQRYRWPRSWIVSAVVPILAAAGLIGYVGVAGASVAVGCLAALSVVFASATIVAWPRNRTSGWTSPGLAVLLAALTLFLAFQAGGYFPGSTGLMAVVFSVLLVLRFSLAERPLAGSSRQLAVAAGALALLVVWQILSMAWSGAPGRALLEADRTLLYLFILLAFGSFTRSQTRLPWLVRGLALTLFVLCTVSLATWFFPDQLPVSSSLAENRLSFPVTYWNTLGLLAAVGVILSFHLAVGDNEPRVLKVFGASAVPIVVTALFFTFSRGALATTAVGLAAYFLLARSRYLVTAAVTVGLPTAAVLVAASRADLLASASSSVSEAAVQGRSLALSVVGSALVAGLLRASFFPLDSRLSRLRVSRRFRVPAFAAIATTALAGVVVAFALGAPAAVERQVERSVANSSLRSDDARTRLLSPTTSARASYWAVTVDNFEQSSALGEGAGSFPLLWQRGRPAAVTAQDGHSLYLETLSELGLVGLFLLVVALGAIYVRLATGARSASRAVYAALFAAALAWGLRAGIDWDWEMAVATAWVFAIGGAALARRSGARRGHVHPAIRLLGGCAIVVIALLPARIAVSEARLENARATLRGGDCEASIREARAASDAMPQRAEPYELIAYCELDDGRYLSAVTKMEQAASRDPRNWRYRWGLAVAKGAAGNGAGALVDAQRARRLNPREPLINQVEPPTRAIDWRQAAPSLLPEISPVIGPET